MSGPRYPGRLPTIRRTVPLTASSGGERVRGVTHSTELGQRDRTVWHQMSGHPAPGKGPFIIAEGDGAWVTDTNGNRYLDGLSGQWCVNVGYGRSRLAEAAARQLE